LRHAQVRAVRLPRVFKRVVYKCNGRAKVNAGASVAQCRGGALQQFNGGCGCVACDL